MRTITLIIIHCSATPKGMDIGVKEIDRWHRQRKFEQIGYHWVVRLDGTIEKGRDEYLIGAHVKDHNTHSIGVCYVGGLVNQPGADGKIHLVPADTRTPEQKTALRQLVNQLHQRYPKAIVLGHRDLSPDLNGNGLIEPNEWLKACPCFDVRTEL